MGFPGRKLPRASPQKASHRSVPAHTPDSAAWSLHDLKHIQKSRSNRRAETLLGRIKRMARDFSVTPQTSKSLSFNSEREIRDALFQLNTTTKILRVDATVVSCRAPRVFGLPRLFAPYGLKGGAARLAVEAILGHDVRALRPRDLDLVRFGGGDDLTTRDTDDRLAQEHMPDDFSHGFGVEVCLSVDQYLQTRDFTINQAALIGGQLICTREALQDTFAGIIRPTAHLLAKGSTLDGKMYMKALRLCAERRARGEESQIENLPDYCLASPFDVALHLARAHEAGHETVAHYLALAFEFGALDPALCSEGGAWDTRTLHDVTESLQEQLGDSFPCAVQHSVSLSTGFSLNTLGLRQRS